MSKKKTGSASHYEFAALKLKMSTADQARIYAEQAEKTKAAMVPKVVVKYRKGSGKLSDEKVREIRRDMLTMTAMDVGLKHGISPRVANDIHDRLNYKHVED